MANRRRKFNAIHKIQVNGELYVDAASAKNMIVHFYENLYHEDQPSRIFLMVLLLPLLVLMVLGILKKILLKMKFGMPSLG